MASLSRAEPVVIPALALGAARAKLPAKARRGDISPTVTSLWQGAPPLRPLANIRGKSRATSIRACGFSQFTNEFGDISCSCNLRVPAQTVIIP